ncbi:M4 family metallopeptidase [Streptomyces phaeochromogenes]|uniref:M4 family metallopeptidase n=1 Tax=Streptomyces phaeochromogenes TaxID=1923 RepID=UPI0007C8EDE0|nr:M4 family metallopeptidase [Streptomyces phaeochromogenes]
MQFVCSFVPAHILDHIARVHARESLDPTDAQRSAVLSEEFRRARTQAPLSVPNTPALQELGEGLVEGIQIPQPGSAGVVIYDDLHQWTYNVQAVRGEGDPAVPGQNANDAYDHMHKVLQYYRDKLGRNSLDNSGLNVITNVNFGVGFDNAFFDPTALLMVFGNGSNVVFRDLTGDIDVAAHELTHGVTQFTSGLNYTADQSGALNESFSDMIASAIDAWVNGHDAASHDWLIGDDIMAPNLNGEALRSMAEPGTAYDNPVMGRDPQPRDMSGYFEPADPHLMSGITNRWFYLICREIGINEGALIMYQTLQNLWPTAKFSDAASVAASQAAILATNKKVSRDAPQVVRATARQQGIW